MDRAVGTAYEVVRDPDGPAGAALFPPYAFDLHWKPGDNGGASVTELFGPAVRDPATWLKFLNSRLGSTPEDVKFNAKEIKALIAMMIAFPDQLVALEYSGGGFAGLPMSNGAVTPLPLDPLLDLIRSPLNMALKPTFAPKALPRDWAGK